MEVLAAEDQEGPPDPRVLRCPGVGAHEQVVQTVIVAVPGAALSGA